MKNAKCPSLIHRRPAPPMRFCTDCGEVVSGDIPIRQCGEKEHATRKLYKETFCGQCGEQFN